MSFEDVKKTVEELAKTERNDLVIIRGSWGVGKTFFWESLIKRLRAEKSVKMQSYAYVSLFGVNDIQTVKNQVSTSLILNRVSSSIGHKPRLRDLFQSDVVKETQRAAEQIPYLKWLPLGLANEAAFMLARDCIICIDDVERKAEKLTIKEVVGLAALLKEQRRCKVVFILNEDILTPQEKEEFHSYNEKLVDWSFDFAPTPESVFGYIFPPDTPDLNVIEESCLRLGIRNVRVLKRISSYLQVLSNQIRGLPSNIREECIRSLILFVWQAHDKETERPSLEFLEDYTSFLFDIGQRTGSLDKVRQEKTFHDLLVRYGYEMTDDVDRELIKFVKSGILEIEKFQSVLQTKISSRNRAVEEQSYQNAWNLYRRQFGDNEEKFVSSLLESFRQNLDRLGIGDLQATAEVLRYFDKSEEANSLIVEFVTKRMNAENIDEWKTWKSLSSVTDEEITAQMTLIEKNKPIKVITFDYVMRCLVGSVPHQFLSEELELLQQTTSDVYYQYFKSYADGNLYYLVDACLKLPQAKAQTIQALRKIKEESRIDRLRVTRLYQLDQFEEFDKSE